VSSLRDDYRLSLLITIALARDVSQPKARKIPRIL